MAPIIPKVSIPKINTQVAMAFLHEEDDHTNNERKEYGAEDRDSWEPQKAHLTGEFVIVLQSLVAMCCVI